MSVSGLCEICQRPDVTATCDRCGKLVCDRHFEPELDVCVECAAQLRGGRPDAADPGGGPDGVDTYRS